MISEGIKQKWSEAQLSQSISEALVEHADCFAHSLTASRREKISQKLAKLVSDTWPEQPLSIDFNQLCSMFLIGFDKLISASVAKKILMTVDYDIIEIAKQIANTQDERLSEEERQHCVAVSNVAKHWDKYVRNENQRQIHRFVV